MWTCRSWKRGPIKFRSRSARATSVSICGCPSSISKIEAGGSARGARRLVRHRRRKLTRQQPQRDAAAYPGGDTRLVKRLRFHSPKLNQAVVVRRSEQVSASVEGERGCDRVARRRRQV